MKEEGIWILGHPSNTRKWNTTLSKAIWSSANFVKTCFSVGKSCSYLNLMVLYVILKIEESTSSCLRRLDVRCEVVEIFVQILVQAS